MGQCMQRAVKYNDIKGRREKVLQHEENLQAERSHCTCGNRSAIQETQSDFSLYTPVWHLGPVALNRLQLHSSL